MTECAGTGRRWEYPCHNPCQTERVMWVLLSYRGPGTPLRSLSLSPSPLLSIPFSSFPLLSSPLPRRRDPASVPTFLNPSADD